jgi:pantoate--beta-alanine ligase
VQVAAEPDEARRLASSLPRPVGFVPTMGALHAGHLALVREAREKSKSLVVSIFVNPMQFAAGEDFERYPRDVDRDRRALEKAGIDLLFTPSTDSMYPAQFSTSVDPGAIGESYEGQVRRGHFCGVATVVLKLLEIVGPDTLYLGQKDAQQTAVLRRVLRDLNVRVAMEVVETVRESDGLALSSRNAYLTAHERAAAPSLYRALLALRDSMASGSDKEKAIAGAREVLDRSARLDYLDVVDAQTFAPVDKCRAGTFVIGAARFGTTRLLDNLWVRS